MKMMDKVLVTSKSEVLFSNFHIFIPIILFIPFHFSIFQI